MPEPVVSLDFDSRYQDDSETRSELDPEAAEAAEAAIAPVDDFLRDLTRAANEAVEDGDSALADCVVDGINAWRRPGPWAIWDRTRRP